MLTKEECDRVVSITDGPIVIKKNDSWCVMINEKLYLENQRDIDIYMAGKN